MSDIQKQRNYGVTIAKAIAIILMVLGHSGCPAVIDHFLCIIRMPVFFMMSGYCFKNAYIDDGKKYLVRRVSGIYIPYIKWSLLFLICHNFLCSTGMYNPEFSTMPEKDMPFTMMEMLKHGIMILTLMVGNDKLIGGFWFLHDLFFGSLVFYFLLKSLKKPYVTTLVLFISALTTNFMLQQLGFSEKMLILSRTLFASFFIASGYAYQRGDFHFEKSWLYIVMVNVIVFLISLFWHTRFQDCNWMQMPLYAILAISGALSVYGIGQHIDNYKGKLRNFLVYVGGKTFNVLTWHMISMKFVSLIIIMIYGIEWARIAEFPFIGEYSAKGWSIIYFIFGVGIPILGAFIVDIIKQKLSNKRNYNR